MQLLLHFNKSDRRVLQGKLPQRLPVFNALYGVSLWRTRANSFRLPLLSKDCAVNRV